MKEELFSRLSGHPWAGHIHYFDSTGSTNDEAKRLAAKGAPHGTVVIADHQTGGRGRMGRSFHSPAGTGIYLSVILRPDRPPLALMHLTCAMACAMCGAVEQSAGIRPGIKWTNDLVFDRRKLGGILTELSLDPRSGLVSHAIVGIGINCCHTPGDFPPDLRDIAGSLAMVTGNQIDRAAVAAAMIRALHAMDEQLFTEKAAIMDRYRSDCVTIGQEVSVHHFDEVRHGTAVGVDDDGGLLVRFPDGRQEAIGAGEVSIRGMYGYV